MSDLVARTGRLQQRYENGYRLVAGCIPFRYRCLDEAHHENSEKMIEVLMINLTSGPGLLFPKGGWENDETVEEAAVREAIEEAGVRGNLLSKTQEDEYSGDGSCKAAMFALLVKKELSSWPEQSTRTRSWLTISQAVEFCRHDWMKEALEYGFCNWLAQQGSIAGKRNS